MVSKNSELPQKKIFFAYQGRSNGLADNNVESIKKAIEAFNQHQKTYKARSWEEYKQTTTISKEILSAIDGSEVFVCDLTYFNHNVLFELGYAIAKNKYILILINENISVNNELGFPNKIYKEFILKDIRYIPFKNSYCIQKALQQKSFENNLLNKFVNFKNLTSKSTDIFYIQSKLATQDSIELTDHIIDYKDNKSLSLVADDLSEIKYQTLTWYFQNLLKARVVLIHLLGENYQNSFMENAKNAFYAGVACGWGCDVLLLAPAKFKPPLDYHDILVTYEISDEIKEFISPWLDKQLAFDTTQEKSEIIEHETNLIELGIGCDIAENESRELLSYFVNTASYQKALNYKKSIVVGRKGSGKSAIYIKLSDDLPEEKNNYIVSLKPESDELLDDIQLSKLFDSSRISFFVAVWKLVIFSKLAISIVERILDEKNSVTMTDEEEAIINFVEKNEEFTKLNFFGVVREVNVRRTNSREISGPEVMETLFKEYLSPLTACLRNYFTSIRKKYYKVIVLADNLDKTWDPKNDLKIQSEMMSTLLEIENKIQKELLSKDSQVEVKQIIFLREDIFNYIRNEVAEPDKLVLMAHYINWEDYPGLLKKLIENRFAHILKLDESDSELLEKKAWREFFNFKEKRHPFEIIQEIITKRPRDLIYFVAKLFESAINNGNHKVDRKDLKYAITSYTEFLNNNLIAETRAEFPEISEILTRLQEYHGKQIEYRKFIKILREFKFNQLKKEKLIETLFNKSYMLGYDKKADKPFDDVKILKKKLGEKRFFFFRNKVFLIAHAKYYLLKNKSSLPF